MAERGPAGPRGAKRGLAGTSRLSGAKRGLAGLSEAMGHSRAKPGLVGPSGA